MNMLMPKRPPQMPEKKATTSRTQGASRPGFQPQKHHHAAQGGLDDPGQGETQQQRAGDHAAHIGQQQRKDLPPLEVVPVFPGDVAVDGAVHDQRAGGQDHVVQPHGQQRRGDQRVAEADEALDGVGQALDAKDERDGSGGKAHDG